MSKRFPIFCRQHILGRTSIYLLWQGMDFAQTYLRFEQVKNRIGPDDIIVIGYADFYDARAVASPRLMRDRESWISEERGLTDDITKFPKVTLRGDGKLVFELVDATCGFSNCEGPEPTQEYMTAVSAKLINSIAEETQARVYVLNIDRWSNKPNALFDKLDKRIEVISALPEDFGYFIRDDIEGFDPHPGPYWHYAISRLLIDRLR